MKIRLDDTSVYLEWYDAKSGENRMAEIANRDFDDLCKLIRMAAGR